MTFAQKHDIFFLRTSFGMDSWGVNPCIPARVCSPFYAKKFVINAMLPSPPNAPACNKVNESPKRKNLPNLRARSWANFLFGCIPSAVGCRHLLRKALHCACLVGKAHVRNVEVTASVCCRRGKVRTDILDGIIAVMICNDL